MLPPKDYPRPIMILLVLFSGIALLILQPGCYVQAAPPAAAKEKRQKPLTEYNSILVEPFTVEKSEATKNFPAGEEANLQRSTVAALQDSNVFEEAIDSSQAPAAEPASGPSSREGKRQVVLSGTVIGYSPGSSAARFMTWPLPVGVSKVKVRFLFRDAQSGREVLRFEHEGKFQAVLSGGVATKQAQMSRLKSGLVGALIKEIKRNR